MLLNKISFDIITKNTIIERGSKASGYFNNCGRHFILDIEDDINSLELTIDIVTGRKTLYDNNEKKYIDFEIRGE